MGDRYVDFTQPDTAGRNVSVSDLKSKLLLLEFWGSWCGPCRQGNPELVKIYHEFKDKGFEILGVAADDRKAYWKAVIMYGINKYPSSFPIDAGGIIIAQYLRGEALRSKLREILK